MYLSPNLFGDFWYRLVTPVILLLLTGGIFYLSKPLLCGGMGASASLWAAVAAAISLLCIETVPSQGETFFWYNGSMYYTGYFALTLFFFGLLLRYLSGKYKRHLPGLFVLALFLAGGNYVSLLPCLILLVLMNIRLIFQKNPKAWGVGITTAAMLAGFLVSAAAPGNRVRQSDMWKIPAWKAVVKSLFQGIRYITAWTGVWHLILVLLLTPLLWKCLKKCSFTFRFPLVAVAFMYGIFCSMSCPTFYTMNSTGPARVVSIVYYGYILFFFSAYCYLLGYIRKNYGEKITITPKIRKMTVGLVSAGAVVLLVIQAFSGNLQTLTTAKAMRLLSTKEAKAYEEEYQQRMQILQDDAIRDAELPVYKNQPDMLYVGDFSFNPQDPLNQNAAAYFHKNSVCIVMP